MRSLRKIVIVAIASGALTLLVAWACVLWSPYRSGTEPRIKADGAHPDEVVGPDGSFGWWITRSGAGVHAAYTMSSALFPDETFKSWRSTHTPAYYSAGFPFLVVVSEVRFQEGYLSKWDLPVSEIVSRGIQTNWLPEWLHAEQDRRLAIVPHWPGFVANAFIYFVLMSACVVLIERWWKKKAQQGARANAHSCHAACYRNENRIEEVDC